MMNVTVVGPTSVTIESGPNDVIGGLTRGTRVKESGCRSKRD